MSSEEDSLTPRELDEQISDKIGDLLDFNSELTKICRKSALDWNRITSSFAMMSAMASEIAEDQARLAAAGASAAADIIAAEWGMDDEMEDEDDDDAQSG